MRLGRRIATLGLSSALIVASPGRPRQRRRLARCRRTQVRSPAVRRRPSTCRTGSTCPHLRDPIARSDHLVVDACRRRGVRGQAQGDERRQLRGEPVAGRGTSALASAVANTVNTFQTRIAVSPNQVLAVWNPAAQARCRYTTTGFASNEVAAAITSPPGSEPAVGAAYNADSDFTSVRLNASAQLEADADNDGYGDRDPGPVSESTLQPRGAAR